MTDTPIPRFDPDRLREQANAVDLGDGETGFAPATHEPDRAPSPPLVEQPTSGITPPAR